VQEGGQGRPECQSGPLELLFGGSRRRSVCHGRRGC
jgi:hypothetical protein